MRLVSHPYYNMSVAYAMNFTLLNEIFHFPKGSTEADNWISTKFYTYREKSRKL